METISLSRLQDTLLYDRPILRIDWSIMWENIIKKRTELYGMFFCHEPTPIICIYIHIYSKIGCFDIKQASYTQVRVK